MKRILLGLSSALFSLPLLAGSMGVLNDAYGETTTSSCAKIVTLSGGPAWYQGGESQPIVLPNGIQDFFIADKPTRTLANGELFFGLGQPLIENLYGQLGIAVAYNGEADLHGIAYAPTRFYQYKYKGSNTRVSLKGKLLPDWQYWIKPYLSGGIGAGFNQNYRYFINPNYFTAPRFDDHTTVGFSFTAGAGLDARLTEHWGVGIGYEFADWGKSSLGTITNSPNPLVANNTTARNITMSHFYTHELLLSVSYFI